MMDATVEHAIGVVPSKSTFQRYRKVWFLCEGVHVNSMEEITTVFTALDLIGLISVRFGREIPCVSSRINDTSSLG